MNKISNQQISLNGKLNEQQKSDDVLGIIFSMPISVNEDQIEEVTIKANHGLIIEKLNMGDNKLKINKNKIDRLNLLFQSNDNIKNKSIKSLGDEAVKTLQLDIKLNKSSKNNIFNKDKNLLSVNEKNSSSGRMNLDNLQKKQTYNHPIDNEDLTLKINKKINEKLNESKSLNFKPSLKHIFEKIEQFKDDNFSETFNDKILPDKNEFRYNKFKFNSENSINVNNPINKIEVTNASSNNSNNQNNFGNDKNINFVLDKLIEELDMTQSGWTEKLVMKLGKAFRDGKEEIELLLKPKELGTLKVSLKMNDKNARIILKAENNASLLALQANESILTKSLSDNGLILEKLSFENFQMSSQQNNNKSSRQDKNDQIDKKNNTEIIKDNEIQDDNSNYIININA